MKAQLNMRLIAGLCVPVVGLSLAGAAPPGHSANAAASAQSQSVAQAFRDMRASKLIRSEVTNAQGEALGKIDDLIIDVNNDRVYYAILSLGGVLGLGDTLFAYPVQMFAQAASGDRLILNVDSTTLKAVPALDRKRVSEWGARYGDIASHFGAPADAQPMPNQLLRRASELIGTNVDGRNGEHIGKISDLVVNIGKGAVRYAAFEFDRPANVNSTAVMIPLGIFDFPADRGDAVINVDRSRLDNALTFDQNRWPLINNPIFLLDVERYLIVADPRRHRAGGDAHAVFDRLDANRDNKLSAAEAGRDSKVLGVWTRMDPAGAGQVTRAEFAARYKAVTE